MGCYWQELVISLRLAFDEGEWTRSLEVELFGHWF